jgi:hypothetical protein
VPGPGSDGHRVRGAGRRGGQPAVPAGRDGRRARGPGRARWFAAGQDPGHSRPAQPRPGVLRAPVPADPLSPRSPATCRHRSRPSGSPATPALRPRPAATNPASTGAQGQQESRHWAASHHATQSAPAQGKAHTAADLDGWPKPGRAGLCRAVVNDLRDASACDVARWAALAVRNARLGSPWGTWRDYASPEPCHGPCDLRLYPVR